MEQVGSGHNAIIENTTFFFLSCRGGRVAKFHFAPPTLACFFLLKGEKSVPGGKRLSWSQPAANRAGRGWAGARARPGRGRGRGWIVGLVEGGEVARFQEQKKCINICFSLLKVQGDDCRSW